MSSLLRFLYYLIRGLPISSMASQKLTFLDISSDQHRLLAIKNKVIDTSEIIQSTPSLSELPSLGYVCHE